MKPGRKPRPIEERFWEKVDKSGECWEWTGGRDRRGYGIFTIIGVTSLAHRVAFSIASGDPVPPSSTHIDHICHNPACVRPSHLRTVTPKQNLENRAGPAANNASGFRGVSWHKSSGKWQAQVTHNRRQYHLGVFEDPEEAARVAAAKRLELFTHNEIDKRAVA